LERRTRSGLGRFLVNRISKKMRCQIGQTCDSTASTVTKDRDEIQFLDGVIFEMLLYFSQMILT
jgi:hypothetical protein